MLSNNLQIFSRVRNLQYLGAHLSIEGTYSSIWKPIVKNIQNKISNWKGSILSHQNLIGGTKLLSETDLKKTTFSSCFPEKSDSPLWKSILSYRVFILDQIKWLIGNGPKVQVFRDELSPGSWSFSYGKGLDFKISGWGNWFGTWGAWICFGIQTLLRKSQPYLKEVKTFHAGINALQGTAWYPEMAQWPKKVEIKLPFQGSIRRAL